MLIELIIAVLKHVLVIKITRKKSLFALNIPFITFHIVHSTITSKPVIKIHVAMDTFSVPPFTGP